MRTGRLTNVSNEKVTVKLTSGVEVSVPPGRTLQGFDVANMDELRGRVEVKHDLTEVTSPSGKTVLRD